MREVRGAQAQVWERKGGLRDTGAEEAHPAELTRSSPTRPKPPPDQSLGSLSPGGAYLRHTLPRDQGHRQQ